MEETCIVCLGDLGESANELPRPDAPTCEPVDSPDSYLFTTSSKSLPYSGASDDGMIAHLLPCGHNLHNDCLKPWVERANSCPICRQNFNLVELSVQVGGSWNKILISRHKFTNITYLIRFCHFVLSSR